jgi:hypothetical protein
MVQKVDDDDDSPQHRMHHNRLKDLKIITKFLTSLRTWGSFSLSQFFILKFEIFGSNGSCCKISIDMVRDYCWLAGSSYMICCVLKI